MRLISLGIYSGIHGKNLKQNPLAKLVLAAKRADVAGQRAARKKLGERLAKKCKPLGGASTLVTFVKSTKTAFEHAKFLAAYIGHPIELPAAVAKCKGKTVLVVDDICRTGRHLRNVARRLYKAGASRVVCVVAAKSEHLAGQTTIAAPK